MENLLWDHVGASWPHGTALRSFTAAAFLNLNHACAGLVAKSGTTLLLHGKPDVIERKRASQEGASSPPPKKALVEWC